MKVSIKQGHPGELDERREELLHKLADGKYAVKPVVKERQSPFLPVREIENDFINGLREALNGAITDVADILLEKEK